MHRLTIAPMWMAIWIHKFRGKADYKKGVAEERKEDNEDSNFMIESQYLDLLREKKKKIVTKLLDEEQLEILEISDDVTSLKEILTKLLDEEQVEILGISDYVTSLKDIGRHESEISEKAHSLEQSSEDNRDAENRLKLKADVEKCHQRYVGKRNDVKTTYKVLEEAYFLGVKTAKGVQRWFRPKNHLRSPVLMRIRGKLMLK